MHKDYFSERMLSNREPLDHSFIERKHLDIPYAGASPAQKLDLYLPDKGDGPFPVVVYIHGGAFMHGDKADSSLHSFLYGLDRGYAVVSLNYRLSGEAIFPAGVLDVKAAMRFLRANAGKYCIDPDRFVAAGASAGGYYAAMLCVTENVDLFDDVSLGYPGVSSSVAAGAYWFPPIDFSTMDDHLAESGAGNPNHNDDQSPEALFMGGPLPTLSKELLRSAIPTTYLHPGIPPMFIQHGRLDRLVPYQQSVDFVEKARAIAGHERVQLEVLDYADHGDALFATVRNMRKVYAFLDSVLK
jgi:acetyl esterase/lipase